MADPHLPDDREAQTEVAQAEPRECMCAGADALGGAAAFPTIASEALFRGQREIMILHGDQMYRLRITRSGKLILQK